MMAYQIPADCCPACTAPEHAPAPVEPYFGASDGTTLTGEYHCPACHHEWWTSWLIDALGPVTADLPAGG